MAGASRLGYGEDGICVGHRADCRDSAHHKTCAGRKARGISQEELAQANAYDRFYLNGLEAGRSTMYITRLLRTLKSLGITLSVTFDLDGSASAERGSGG